MADYCPACGVGKLTQTQRTYIHIYGGTLVHVPGVLAWRCDVCHLVIFDEIALGRIELLVGQSGPPPNIAPGRAVPAPEPPDIASREDLPEEPPHLPEP